jgi:hypothetical protein
MTTTNINGQQRKTLASQIDRLDGLIDTLGAGLTGAVAGAVEQAVESAVRQAVGLAVREAVTAILGEVLTNADLRTALAPAPPVVEDRNTLPPRGGLTQTAGRAWGWMKGRLGAGLRLAHRGACAGWQRVTSLGPMKGPLALAAGVGALGVTAYLCGPYLAAACGCAVGLAAARLREAREGLRRLLPAFDTD